MVDELARGSDIRFVETTPGNGHQQVCQGLLGTAGGDAEGSAEETAACLYVADAWGYLGPEQTAACLAKLEHLMAILGESPRPQ